jgi:hypothetical protein
VVRNLVERAFTHLQYSIIADSHVRATWNSAFNEGEAACERLGGTHLLLHGIWAFKTNAPGEPSDLVLGTRLEITPQVERAAEGLVLTEWKVVREPKELTSKAAEAFIQARLYGMGSLAGFELATRRYLVIVSKDRLTMPQSRFEGLVRYQYENVCRGTELALSYRSAEPRRRDIEQP